MRNPNTNTNQKQLVGTNLLTKPMIFQYTQTSDDSIPIQTIHIKQPKLNSKYINYVSQENVSNKITNSSPSLA